MQGIRFARIAALSLLILLTSAATASAARNYLQLAQNAAVRYWHNKPCNGLIHVSYVNPSLYYPETIIALPAGFEILAQTSFATPDGDLDYNEPPSTYSDCEVALNDQVWPKDEPNNWPLFCALMVHEYGHLEGYPDTLTDNPHSITYQNITPLNENLSVCHLTT